MATEIIDANQSESIHDTVVHEPAWTSSATSDNSIPLLPATTPVYKEDEDDSRTLLGMKVGVIIQARATSQRFPNKVMAKFEDGTSVLQCVINKVRRLGLPVIVAIPNTPGNDVLAEYLEKFDVKIYRGKENDVLDRFIQAADNFGLELIIRVCADSPLINENDIVNNLNQFTAEQGCRMIWGMGSWVFTLEMLQEVAHESAHAEDWEHCGFHYLSRTIDWADDIERVGKHLI